MTFLRGKGLTLPVLKWRKLTIFGILGGSRGPKMTFFVRKDLVHLSIDFYG